MDKSFYGIRNSIELPESADSFVFISNQEKLFKFTVIWSRSAADGIFCILAAMIYQEITTCKKELDLRHT